MNVSRQKLIQAITKYEYDIIASYLDDDYIHSDQSKAIFMKNFRGMMEMIRESNDTEIYVCGDVDLSAFTKENNYKDPIYFRIEDSYFILDIYQTDAAKFCIDMGKTRFIDTEVKNSYQMSIFDDERVSYIPNETYLALRASIYKIFTPEKTNRIYLWTPKCLKDWLAEHQLILDQLKNYDNIKEMILYSYFYDQARELCHAYQNYNYLIEAIEAYKDVDYRNEEQNYNWVNDFDGLRFPKMRSCELKPHEEYKEFFSVEPSIPNHYFLLKGYEQLIPYFNLNRVAYCTSNEYRCQSFIESLLNKGYLGNDKDE